MDLRPMREVNTGFGDGLATAFELVATPMLFGFFGYLIDGRLGTKPIFTVALALFVFGYCVWKLVVKYNADLDKALEERKAATSARQATNRAAAQAKAEAEAEDRRQAELLAQESLDA